MKLNWYLLLKNKFFWGMYSYMILSGIFMVYQEESVTGVLIYNKIFSNFNLTTLYLCMLFFIKIIVDYKSGEYEDSLAFGYSKNKIFLEKIISPLIGMVIINLSYVCTTIIFAINRGGLGTDVNQNYLPEFVQMILRIVCCTVLCATFSYVIALLTRNYIIYMIIFLGCNLLSILYLSEKNSFLSKVINYTFLGMKDLTLFKTGISFIINFFIIMFCGIKIWNKSDVR